MNTEDKAREIAKLKNPKLAEFPNLSAVYEYGLECAMKMAEWKDKQFENIIEYVEICYGVFQFNERERFIKKIKELYYGE